MRQKQYPNLLPATKIRVKRVPRDPLGVVDTRKVTKVRKELGEGEWACVKLGIWMPKLGAGGSLESCRTLVGITSSTRSSSREVRIRVPTFYAVYFSSLTKTPPPRGPPALRDSNTRGQEEEK